MCFKRKSESAEQLNKETFESLIKLSEEKVRGIKHHLWAACSYTDNEEESNEIKSIISDISNIAQRLRDLGNNSHTIQKLSNYE